jgi:hypothetical protein
MSGPSPADTDARAGLWLAIVGLGLLPLTLIAVGVSPQGARATVFLVGVAATATLSLWAGAVSRRALATGTTRTTRAVVAGIVGFVVGVTAALMVLTSLVGILL